MCADGRFAVGIDDDLQTKLREPFRKMGYKQFSSTVIHRRYGDERRRNESDFQIHEPWNLSLVGQRCCKKKATLGFIWHHTSTEGCAN